MKIQHEFLALLFTLLICSQAYADNSRLHSSHLVDDRGQVFLFERIAKRIISLSPAITELVFAAGAGKKLVGVSRFSDYPDAAQSIAGIGDAFSLDFERVIALKPDLVIAWHSGNAKLGIEQLERLGLPVFVTEATKLEDIPRLLRIIGKLAGTSEEAESAAHAFEIALQQLKQDYTERKSINVFQLIWPQPLITVGSSHIINEIIKTCGGRNVFAALPDLMPVISEENLIASNPEVILSSVSNELLESGEHGLFQRFSYLPAVKNHQVYFIHPDLIHRQSPRILEATKMICEQLDSIRAQ